MSEQTKAALLNDLDDELSGLMATPSPKVLHPPVMVHPVQAELFSDDTPNVSFADRIIPIVNEMDTAYLKLQNAMLDAEPIIGQHIIDIRQVSGKKKLAAIEALRTATVDMFNKASEDCFYIPGNVASSKNSKEIGVFFRKNPITGVNDKFNTLVDSKATQKYIKSTAGYWLENKVAFLNTTRHLPMPVKIEFTFIRETLGRFDFINACQVLADLMVKNGYFDDDDSVHFVPVFNPIVYYHSKLAGVLIRVIK